MHIQFSQPVLGAKYTPPLTPESEVGYSLCLTDEGGHGVRRNVVIPRVCVFEEQQNLKPNFAIYFKSKVDFLDEFLHHSSDY